MEGAHASIPGAQQGPRWLWGAPQWVLAVVWPPREAARPCEGSASHQGGEEMGGHGSGARGWKVGLVLATQAHERDGIFH